MLMHKIDITKMMQIIIYLVTVTLKTQEFEVSNKTSSIMSFLNIFCYTKEQPFGGFHENIVFLTVLYARSHCTSI